MSDPSLPSLVVLVAISAAILYNQKKLDELKQFLKAQMAQLKIDVGPELKASCDRIVSAIGRRDRQVLQQAGKPVALPPSAERAAGRAEPTTRR